MTHCPGCHESESRNYDEDELCDQCRSDVDSAERLVAYAAVLTDLQEDGWPLVAAATWVGEA